MANGSRSFHSLNGIEPTPNREQRVLAHYAEVRRRKTVGKWQSFALLTEWQVNKLLYAIQHSQSAHAIKGVARMPLNAIKELL